MIIKILGLLDIISGVFLGLGYFGFFKEVALVFAFYLLVKSIIFIKGFASIVDLITAVVFFLVIYGINGAWVWIFVLWLLQKGFISLLG